MVKEKQDKIEPIDLTAEVKRVFGETPQVNKEEFIETIESQRGSLITFDAYFQNLLSKNLDIKEHHKEPIKLYIQKFSKNLLDTEEAFNKILEDY